MLIRTAETLLQQVTLRWSPVKIGGADGQVLTAGKSGKVPPGQVNGSGNVTEAFRYFYHPDHLGSTSYVTDASGEVYQHLEYFAFEETFVEEHSNTDRTPYLFNGKELDAGPSVAIAKAGGNWVVIFMWRGIMMRGLLSSSR